MQVDPWIGKIPWSRKWQLLQYSCLKNFMDRGAWGYSPWASQSQTWLSDCVRALARARTHTHNVLRITYCPLYHPHNKERDIPNILGEILRPRDVNLPGITELVNDISRNQIWFPLTLNPQFLIAAPRDLQRMRAGQGVRGNCYGEEGATSKTKRYWCWDLKVPDPVGTCPQLANTAARTF